MKLFIIFTLIIMVFTGCGTFENESLSADMRTKLQKLPTNAHMIGYVNLTKLKSSPLYELFGDDVEDQVMHNEEYQEFLEATGFDFEKNLAEIYFASTPTDDPDKQKGLFIASGEFNPDKIVAYIQEKDEDKILLAESYKEYTLYYLEDENIYFCFQDEKTIVGGSGNLVKKALDNEVSEGKLKLMPQIESLKYKSWAWMTVNTESVLNNFSDYGISESMPIVNSISSASMAIKLTDNLYFNGGCICSDGEKAELVKDAIKGGIAAVKLSVSEDRDTIDILNSIKVKTDNNRVITEGEMSKKEFENIIAQKNKVISI